MTICSSAKAEDNKLAAARQSPKDSVFKEVKKKGT